MYAIRSYYVVLGEDAEVVVAPSVLPEQRVALAGEARGTPAAFLRRLGEQQRRRHRVDAALEFVKVVGAVALGEVGEPGLVVGLERDALADRPADVEQTLAVAHDVVVDRQRDSYNFV